jgi:hypothetical protein
MDTSNTSVQSPFFVIFSLKSPADMQVLLRDLPPLLPQIAEAADTIGTLHFARFVVLGDTTLGFASVFDGELHDYIMDFSKFLGPAFDMLFDHVVDPPPTPVARNAEAHYEWVMAHKLEPVIFYSGYPTLRVQDIKALAAGA